VDSEYSIVPAVVRGDPFVAAANRLRLEQGCSCLGGFHYIGHMICDPESGDGIEVYSAYPCGKCGRRGRE
jgi:hypothetical protein